jgi:alkanesulfonate monooxygenase SsuD/methylene tetrahydromethanopterin reductase-like flavin-dependent oxidoreductase (luciferase family)
MVHCADTDEQARQNAAESIVWYLKKSVALIGTLATWQEEQQRELGTYEYAKTMQSIDLSGLTFEVLDDMGAVIVGTPERCIERVRRYQEAGCDQLLCLMNPYKIPTRAVARSIELFGREVIPAFR